ncbi:PQQ-dependent sugar dehydrogenase [Natronobiforma cellulositropha]|uniref:PQQ-dependent sugar dehydrogenase n=1 Tax=Natronobiforma cellulositropha TaxID=1679076 RepID=UPI0021D5F30A|nr:PQQ-dependent sugar dehydrogenase [Natronobiforma cellulositropha]
MTPLSRRKLLATAAGAALAGSVGLVGANTHTDGQTTTNADRFANPRDSGWRPADGSPLDASVSATQVMTGLDYPWDLTFAGDDAFFTERPGRIRRIDTDDLVNGAGIPPHQAEVVLDQGNFPPLNTAGEGGTLGIAAHPSYPSPREIFVYYTVDGADIENRVDRINLDTGTQTTVIDGIPGEEIHNGGRIEIGPDGHLWILAGDGAADYEATDIPAAQDPGSLAGTVIRITLDGEVPSDNPDIGPDADPRVYTYGHRNPQGLAFTPDGEAVLIEHGPTARDEIHVLCAGSNYGWSEARGGPADPDWDSYAAHDEYAAPVVNTGTNDGEDTWAPSGATFYTSDAIPEFQNRAFIGGLRSQTLFALSLYPAGANRPHYPNGTNYDDDWLDSRYQATTHRLFEEEWTRIRHAEEGPNGELFLLVEIREIWGDPTAPPEGENQIIRLDPV